MPAEMKAQSLNPWTLVVRSISRGQVFETPRTAALPASLTCMHHLPELAQMPDR